MFAYQPELNLQTITMTRSSSNSAKAQAERHFTVRFSKYDSADRNEIERFIIDTLHHTYGADIKRFKPYLMSLRDQDNKLIAVCGLHSAATERLFLESFLDKPIEALLSEHTGTPVKRGDIVEIDNFSVEELGMTRHLVTAINDQLYFTAKQWAVLTATPALRDVFIELGIHPEILADTDINLLSSEDRIAWGNYFEQKPLIMAIRRTDRRNTPRTGNTGSTAT
jgi:hypothetical protein